MTLGIMGLDKVGLQIVATAGDTEKERRHARTFIFWFSMAPPHPHSHPATRVPRPPSPPWGAAAANGRHPGVSASECASSRMWHAGHAAHITPGAHVRNIRKKHTADSPLPSPDLARRSHARARPTNLDLLEDQKKTRTARARTAQPATSSLTTLSPPTPPPPPHSINNTGSLLPIREKGNWLMCTLLIANTVANVFLPILVASFAGGLVGFIVSTILILLLAEIVPQVCVGGACVRVCVRVAGARTSTHIALSPSLCLCFHAKTRIFAPKQTNKQNA